MSCAKTEIWSYDANWALSSFLIKPRGLSEVSEMARLLRLRLPALIATGLVPAVFLFLQGPLCDSVASQNALRLLVTVLSILTGFVIATITMLGDTASLSPGSWRVASAQAEQTRHVVNRLAVLFYVYLSAILFALLGILLSELLPDQLHKTISHAALCLGVAALIWSFGLPVAIKGAALRRLRKEIDERRGQPRAEALPPLTKD